MKSIVLPGTLDSLEPLGEFLEQVAEEAGLDTKAAYRLRLAVDEVVTNSIVHGYDEAGLKGDIRLEAVIDDKAVTVTVADTGMEFDPMSLKPPENLDAPLEEREMGGLGVYLALKTMDSFTYERRGNENLNRFVVFRKAK